MLKSALLLLALHSDLWARPAIMGFNFPTWWKDAYSAAPAQRSLELLAQTGADSVALTPTWFMRDKTGSAIFPTDSTASDESVRAAMRRAKGLGLTVVLKPHVDPQDGTLRAMIDPADADAWFSSYRTFILHYAVMAREEGAGLFVVGTELASMATPWRRARWERLIAEIRGVYPGKLTFAANWYGFAAVPFWGSLDYIGIDAYFPLVGGKNRFILRESMKACLPLIAAEALAHGKPVLFTEFGIAAQKGANLRPWAYGDFGALDLDVQTAYLQAVLEVLGAKPYFAGFLQWGWETDPNAGGPKDKSMTVQGKPALDVLKRYFRPAPAPPPVDPAALRRVGERVQKALSLVPGF